MTPQTMAFMLVVAALLGVSAIRWQRAFVMSLPLLATFNGLSVPVGIASVRADQLVACALVVALAASTLIGRRTLRLDAIAWLLAALVGLNVVASATHSPARSYSLAQCANLASVWVMYVLCTNFLETREDLERFFERLLVAAAVASAIGVAAYVLAVAGLPVGGADVSTSAARRLTTAYGAYGTMVEPNILGGFAAAYLVITAALLVLGAEHPTFVARWRVVRWTAALAALALVLTFTRAAWVAAAVGLGALLVLRRRSLAWRVRWRRVLVPLGAAVVLAVALLLAPGDAGALFRFKLFNLLNPATQTGVVRVVSYALALQQTADHPLLGWGTFTFAPLVAQGADFQQFDNWRNLWIGNYLILALHDTGVIGLGVWVALLWCVLRRGIATLRVLREVDPAASGRVFALLLGIATLLVAFLATSGFSFGYSWILIGLLGAHGRLVEEREPLRVNEPAVAGAALPHGG